MNFVEYKLDKLSLINFDQSLISENLQTELCVNQRSRYLEAVPVCKVTKAQRVADRSDTLQKHWIFRVNILEVSP